MENIRRQSPAWGAREVGGSALRATEGRQGLDSSRSGQASCPTLLQAQAYPRGMGLQGSRREKQPTFLRAQGRGESGWVLPGAPTGSKGKSSCLGSAYTSSVVATTSMCGWLFRLTFTLIKTKYI